MADARPSHLVAAPGVADGLARAPRSSARRVISVGGGKGGVGKTVVAANLAIELARRGRRVVLLDADLGGANLHTCLGVDMPRRSLSDFVERRVDRIDEVIVPTPVPNLGLISGAMDHLGAANPTHAHKMRLLRHLQGIEVDHVILDLGAGTHLNVLDFFLVSDRGILVLVPEPTSVENVYRFVKAAFWRRVRNVVAMYGFEEILERVLREVAFRSALDVIAGLRTRHPEAGRIVMRELSVFRPCLVVNQTRTAQDAEIGAAVLRAWRKFFGLEMDYLGDIPYDEDMWRMTRARLPLLLHSPRGAAARSFGRIADRLESLEVARARQEGAP